MKWYKDSVEMPVIHFIIFIIIAAGLGGILSLVAEPALRAAMRTIIPGMGD